jgi:hypothetical protein
MNFITIYGIECSLGEIEFEGVLQFLFHLTFSLFFHLPFVELVFLGCFGLFCQILLPLSVSLFNDTTPVSIDIL